MNAILIDRVYESQAAHAAYLTHRVIDAFLREDVRACASCGEVVRSAALPRLLQPYKHQASHWLKIDHLGNGRLWIAVQRATFMQDWRCAGLPLLLHSEGQLRELHTPDDIIGCFALGLSERSAALFAAFAEECAVALAHRTASEAERDRWFKALRRTWASARPGGWHARLMHYDRLGAFLDHPLYPTARAKLGFSVKALEAYGPEFQRSFSLRWLAVPQDLHHPAAREEQDWPAGWPSFADVGLAASMKDTHALVPVHPFMWERPLDDFLRESGLAARVVRAPRAHLTVAPTLSVRTVALLDAPAWHLKLPLTIRTLGAKNIRTIKPGTIGDGHRIQTLLGAIAAREPALDGRLLLTDESRGAHVDHQVFLGYILRRYPDHVLQDSTLVPVASLTAPSPSGRLVMEDLAAQFYYGDAAALFDDYLALTLRLHLLLWLRYGIALESNQQNSVVVLSHTEPRLRLLLKDNDAARIHGERLGRRWPALAAHLDGLQDRRIIVAEQLSLAQMFATITLQLNIAVPVERLAPLLGVATATLYARVRQKTESLLDELAAEGEDTSYARQVLLEDAHLPIKYLLVAATLADKADTGAADVNKFYGHSAPNFLRQA